MLQNAVVHPVVPAADINRAKAFYSDKLGADAGDGKRGRDRLSLQELMVRALPVDREIRSPMILEAVEAMTSGRSG
jgi:catechol 2,3-dioxygenase-like lactoylglutathione lyase family enzyme